MPVDRVEDLARQAVGLKQVAELQQDRRAHWWRDPALQL